MKLPRIEVFNDGYFEYGTMKTLRSANKKAIGKEFQSEITPVAFKYLSARDSDYQMAETMNSQLDLKIKAYYFAINNVTRSGHVIKLNDRYYDIINTDVDTDRRYIYLYLQEVTTNDRNNTEQV